MMHLRIVPRTRQPSANLSPYVTIDAELTACAAILRIDLTHDQLSQALEVLEEKGPFTQTFIQQERLRTIGPFMPNSWAASSWLHPAWPS
jgi:hypothetical protein